MAIQDDIKELEDLIVTGLTTELKEQGHIMTGRLAKSIRIKTRIFLNGFEMEGSFFRYGAIIDRGTKANRIPFGGTTGKKTSKYIQGLVEFVKKRRIETNQKKALGVAFAIAKTQKKEGMPTKGSFAFSKNGRRIDWIDFGFEQINERIFNKLGDIFGKSFEGSIDNIIKRQNL